MRTRSKRGRWLVLAVIPLAGLSLHIPRWFGVPPLVLLETGTSMPTGLYVYDHALPAAPGDVVVLAKAPHWGRAYLMKTVVGRGGDVFCWDERQAGATAERPASAGSLASRPRAGCSGLEGVPLAAAPTSTSASARAQTATTAGTSARARLWSSTASIASPGRFGCSRSNRRSHGGDSALSSRIPGVPVAKAPASGSGPSWVLSHIRASRTMVFCDHPPCSDTERRRRLERSETR